MNWVRDNPRSALLCALSLLLPVLLWLYAAIVLWEFRAESAKAIDHLHPRIARLQGLIEFEQELAIAADQARQQVAALAYPASIDNTELSASMQSDIRQLFSDAGMIVGNSQVASPRDEELLERISVRLSVSGELGALQEALLAVAAHEPVLLVESLEVRPLDKRGGKQSSRTVSAAVQVQALRIKG